MNLKSFKLSTNIWIILSVIILMLFFYFFYFEYYVKNKEDRITSTRFRVLDQMGKNIDRRLASFTKNASDLEKKIDGEWNSILKESKDEKTNKIDLLIDALNNKGDINKSLKVVGILTGNTQSSLDKQFTDISSLRKYFFSVPIKDPPFNENEWFGMMIIETSYKDLIKGFQRDDVFDGIILVRDSVVIYNSLGQEMLLAKKTDEWWLSDESEQTKSTSKAHTNLGNIVSGEVFDMSVSNRSYKGFLKPIEINGTTWYSIGLMKSANFNAASRSIDPWIIVLLSLLLIFIILAMPVVKLKVLSKTEQLDTKTIINYGLSSILGGTIIVLFLIFLTQDMSTQQEVNKKLEDFSDTIYKSLNKELEMAYSQMEYYDPLYNELNFSDEKNPYNSNLANDILNKGGLYFPGIYPYGDYYFWTNNKGKQVAYLTPLNSYGDMSDLSSRDYVNKKDEWFFPGSDDKKFRFESIVSVTSSAVKAAVSKKGDSIDRPVVAISTKLFSIINTIIPQDYSYCIIDKTGNVWFHSNENLNLKENFISECNDDNLLQAALYADIGKSIDVNYYNEPHRIYVQPLDNLPLYLVTLYNKKSIKSFQLQVITISLLFLSILLFLLFVQIIALLIIEGRYRLALTKNILMKLTRPIMRLNGEYRYLIKVYIIIQLVFIPFILWFENMDAILAVFILIIILFPYSYRVLNQNEIKTEQRKWFSLFNIILLVFVNAAAIYFSANGGYWKILFFQLVIFSVLVLSNRFLKKESEDLSEYWTNYTGFLISIMILFGLIPTLKFYEIAYNTEIEFRVRHNLIDLMNQREERNIGLFNDFKKMKSTPTTDKILNERKNLGIYVSFNDSLQFSSIHPVVNENSSLAKNIHWDTLISFLRPVFDEYIIENKYLLLNNPANKNILWHQDGKSLTLEYSSLTEQVEMNTIQPFFIHSIIPKLNLLVPFSAKSLNPWLKFAFNFLFWMSILFVIIIFYKLLKFGVYNIFCHNVIENYFHQDFDEMLNHQMLANKDIFVARLSPNDETDIFLEEFKSKPGHLVISFLTRENVKKTNASIDEFKKNNSQLKTISVLLSNFDKDFENPEIFKEKIDTILPLVNRTDIKLVLFSQVKLEVISESYEDVLLKMNKKQTKKSKEKQAEFKLHQEVLGEFNQLMKSFIIDFLPVRYHHTEKLEAGYCHEKPKKIDNKKLIKNELYASDNLRQYEDALNDFNKTYTKKTNRELPEEMIVSKINTLAEVYFEDLFNSCTPEEQYVLFDIAYDMIINPKNEKAIINLLRKGILVKKCYKINVMNISFRRFVISKLNKSTKTKLELVMGKDKGSWQGYRATLVLIIIALFVFIGMANQDFVDNLNQLFIALGGGIAVITGVLGLMSRKKGNSLN